VVPALIEAMQYDEDSDVRLQAAFALRHYPSATAAFAVAAQKNSDSGVRLYATAVLELWIGDPGDAVSNIDPGGHRRT
jgi:HEAT repeat protein